MHRIVTALIDLGVSSKQLATVMGMSFNRFKRWYTDPTCENVTANALDGLAAYCDDLVSALGYSLSADDQRLEEWTRAGEAMLAVDPAALKTCLEMVKVLTKASLAVPPKQNPK
jgi:hypothetical protein